MSSLMGIAYSPARQRRPVGSSEHSWLGRGSGLGGTSNGSKVHSYIEGDVWLAGGAENGHMVPSAANWV